MEVSSHGLFQNCLRSWSRSSMKGDGYVKGMRPSKPPPQSDSRRETHTRCERFACWDVMD